MNESTEELHPESGETAARESAAERNPPDAADAPDAVDAPDAATTDEEFAGLREQNAFLLDQLQRARAELENYRRRTITERGVQERRVTAAVFRAIVPLYDSLLRALEAEESAEDAGTRLEGLRIIAGSFQQILVQFEIRAIEAVGQPFDPNLHDAVFQQESDEVPEGHVLEEIERGYLLGEELLRPARVKVARAPAGDDE